MMKFILLLLAFASCVCGREVSPNMREELEADALVFARISGGVDGVELFSLDPRSGWDSQEKKEATAAKRLQQWMVVGKAVVKDATEIARIRAAVLEGIRSSDGVVASCFNPRHALRFRNRGAEFTVIICFECRHAIVAGTKELDGFRTSARPEEFFNRLFAEKGLTVLP
jgi:hypothetical protein